MPKAGKSNAMKRLGELLQDRVSTGKISVASIAEKTGIEQSLVYKYMRGDRPGTSLDTFLALIDAVGAHPADVFGDRKGGAPAAVIEAHERVTRYLRGK
jgi:transcriptional regulator with XRE-family HTH domain